VIHHLAEYENFQFSRDYAKAGVGLSSISPFRARGILFVTTSPPTAEATPFSMLQRKARLWPLCLAFAFVVLAATGFYLIDAHWPYRYRNVDPLLQKIFASQIKIDHYHRTYFPNPGFVATGLTLRRNSALDLPPVGSARSLVVQGRWLDLLLLRKRVRLVGVEGLHIVIPPVGSRANQEDFPPGSSADFGGPTTVVEQLNIRDATLDIMRTDGNRYSFPIRQLIIRNLRKGQSISYLLDMQNAKPTGRIQSAGSFGPLLPNNLGATPVSGDFTFSRANLGDITESAAFSPLLVAFTAPWHQSRPTGHPTPPTSPLVGQTHPRHRLRPWHHQRPRR
jgi:hypothetical protein